LIEGMSRPAALFALRKLYDGSHLTHPGVHFRQAKEVKISSSAGLIGLDLDGEHATGSDLTFSIRPGLLHMLA
jgi:diacylglycerol kinase family enzyme